MLQNNEKSAEVLKAEKIVEQAKVDWQKPRERQVSRSEKRKISTST